MAEGSIEKALRGHPKEALWFRVECVEHPGLEDSYIIEVCFKTKEAEREKKKYGGLPGGGPVEKFVFENERKALAFIKEIL